MMNKTTDLNKHRAWLRAAAIALAMLLAMVFLSESLTPRVTHAAPLKGRIVFDYAGVRSNVPAAGGEIAQVTNLCIPEIIVAPDGALSGACEKSNTAGHLVVKASVTVQVSGTVDSSGNVSFSYKVTETGSPRGKWRVVYEGQGKFDSATQASGTASFSFSCQTDSTEKVRYLWCVNSDPRGAFTTSSEFGGSVPWSFTATPTATSIATPTATSIATPTATSIVTPTAASTVTPTAVGPVPSPPAAGPTATAGPFAVGMGCEYEYKDDPGLVICSAATTNKRPDAEIVYEWRLDDQPQGSQTRNELRATGVVTGDHTVTVVARDAKNNLTTQPASISFTKRQGAPPGPKPADASPPILTEAGDVVNTLLTGIPAPNPPDLGAVAAATAAGAAILGLLLAANNALAGAASTVSQVASGVAGWPPAAGTGKPTSVPEGTTAGSPAAASPPTTLPGRGIPSGAAPPSPPPEPTTLLEQVSAVAPARPVSVPEAPPPTRPPTTMPTLAPEFKPPKDYGPGKTNPWDPPVAQQQQMWVNQGVVWDPETLSWRPPKPGEIPPPPDAPEKPPPYQQQQPRDKVPIECLELYDAYVKAQARVMELGSEIQAAAERQWQAQLELNKLLAKFTLKLGWDVADTVLLADGVARLTVALGEAMSRYLPRALAEALESARSLFRKAAGRTGELAEKMSEAGRIASGKVRVAENLRTAARAARNEADEARRLLSEAEETLSKSQKAAAKIEEEIASTTGKLDDLVKEQAELAARKALAEENVRIYRDWYEANLKYLGKKPAAGIGSRFYDEAFKLDMLGLDIATTKVDISNLRSIPNPSPAQMQQLAGLEGKLANLYDEALPLKKVLDDAACRFYGVDDVSKITNEFMEQHLKDHLRRTMGDDLYKKWDAAPAERLLGAKDELASISQKLQGLEGKIVPLQQQLNKAQTAVVNLQAQAAAAQREVTKVAAAAPLAASAASRTQVEDAERDEREAQAQLAKVQAELEAAKREGETARRDLESLETKANEYPKRTFAETPEEVAKVLMDARQGVQRAVEELKARQAEHDRVMDDLRWLKPRLDQCIYSHT